MRQLNLPSWVGIFVYSGVLLILLSLPFVQSIYEWSFQQRLVHPSAGSTYAKTPAFLVGRGLQTLVTGFDAISPAILVHTNDDGYVRDSDHMYVWSLQARLFPPEVRPTDGFGGNMVASEQTIIVSSPFAGDRRGFAYIFNGTTRHWSYVQRLQAAEASPGDLFGGKLFLNKDQLVVGARGTTGNVGAVYVFQRMGKSVFWSRTSKLLPQELRPNSLFGDNIALYENIAVVGSRDSNDGTTTGSMYVYKSTGGLWSQQQKLIAIEMQLYAKREFMEKLNVALGDRFLGRSYTITNNYDIAVGVTNNDPGKNIMDSVYVFKTTEGSGRWSLQQKLFARNDTHSQLAYGTDVYSDQQNTLIATATGPNQTVAYLFKTFGNGWSLQSQLISYNVTTDGTHYDGNYLTPRPPVTNFSNPTIWGGTLFFSAGNEVQIRTQYRYGSCLLFTLSDHYLDGWDTAVLTVRAPDLTRDTFHPHCDQINPFKVRYCPYQPSDEGVYIVKVFAATSARFFWEISWTVFVESTQETFHGDFSTKLEFNFNATSSEFSLVKAQNLVDLNAPCYTCTTIARSSWKELQLVGNNAFWPLVVSGAPYYISDYQGKQVAASGKVCRGIQESECYQTLTNGIYTLRLRRLGGFDDTNKTNYAPTPAFWRGCGENGTALDQFIFQIANGKCTPLQKYRYRSRCSRPPPLNPASYSSTKAPTHGGTVAPTQSVYGLPYMKGKMYALRHDGSVPKENLEALEKEIAALEAVSAPRDSIFESTMDQQTRAAEKRLEEVESSLVNEFLKEEKFQFRPTTSTPSSTTATTTTTNDRPPRKEKKPIELDERNSLKQEHFDQMLLFP